MSLTKTLKPAMTIAELKESPVWGRLAEQQRILLSEYLSAGLAQGQYDPAAAVRLAYPKIKSMNLKVWMSRLQSNPRIRAVLAHYFGDGEIAVAIAELQRLIKRSKRKGAQLDLLVPYWMRTVDLLEALAGRSTLDVKSANQSNTLQGRDSEL
jgi:hypothetical protein